MARGAIVGIVLGREELGYIDCQSENFEKVESMPGFLRGLSFADNYAFGGLVAWT